MDGCRTNPSQIDSQASELTETFILSKSEIVDKLKDLICNSNQNGINLIPIYKAIIKSEDMFDILNETIEYIWSSDRENCCAVIYMLISVCSNLDLRYSELLLNNVKKLITEEKLYQTNLIKVIPILLGNISNYNEKKIAALINSKELKCHIGNIAILAQSIRQMKCLTNNEKGVWLKKLVDYLNIVEFDQCHIIINEILRWCDKVNIQYCIGAIVNFFNDHSLSSSQLSQLSQNEDNQRIIDIQKSVLQSCYDISSTNVEFTKELLKFCKSSSSLYCISGFMCIILLKLASLNYVKDSILELLKSSIISCLQDNKLFMESAFARECQCEHCDLNYLLTNSIKFCVASDKDHIAPNLIELAFQLIKASTPQSKVLTNQRAAQRNASTTTTSSSLIDDALSNDFSMSIQQKTGQAGIKMILHLFLKMVSHRENIIQRITNFILKESHKNSVYVYIELLSDLTSIYPVNILQALDPYSQLTNYNVADSDIFTQEMDNSINDINRHNGTLTSNDSLIDCLFDFPVAVSLSIIHALLPLIRYSPGLRDRILHCICTNILSGKANNREISIESALTIIKYFKIPLPNKEKETNNEEYLLSQASQFASTQIYEVSARVKIDTTLNWEICTEILQLLSQSVQQYPVTTKTSIYTGLISVAQSNLNFIDNIVTFLRNQLLSCFNPQQDQLLLDQIHDGQSWLEPLPILIAALSQILFVKGRCSTRQSTQESVGELLITLCDILLDNDFNNDWMAVVYDAIIGWSVSYELNDTDKLLRLIEKRDIIVKSIIPQFSSSLANINNSGAKKPSGDSSNEAADRSQFITKGITGFQLNVYCYTELMRHFTEEFIVSNSSVGNVIDQDGFVMPTHRPSKKSKNDSSSLLSVYEKLLVSGTNSGWSIKLLDSLRDIGSSKLRVNSRNRLELCKSVARLVEVSLGFYMECLCRQVNNNQSESAQPQQLTTVQRQIMHGAILIYTYSLDKVVLYLSKSIDKFIDHLSKDTIQQLQDYQQRLISNDPSKAIRSLSSTSQHPLTQEWSSPNNTLREFIDLNRSIIKRLLIMQTRRFYSDAEVLLKSSYNLAFYCGIEDAKLLPGQHDNNLTFGLSEVNTKSLNNLGSWIYRLLQTSRVNRRTNESFRVDINDAGLCKTMLSVYMGCSRSVMPDFAGFIDKITSDCCNKIGILDDTTMTSNIKNKDNNFKFINNAPDLVPILLYSLNILMTEVDWLISKWKSGWTDIKQRKAISTSQFSNLTNSQCTPTEIIEQSMSLITDLDRQMNHQLVFLCVICNKLMHADINNIVRMQDLVKLVMRLFTQLNTVAKQYVQLSRQKLGVFSSVFEKLVQNSGQMSSQVSNFIVYLQRVESQEQMLSVADDSSMDSDIDVADADCSVQTPKNTTKQLTAKKSKKKANSINQQLQLGRTAKDLKLIPKLIFTIEQYQATIIDLQKLTKINLMGYIKAMSSRDFHIYNNKVHESLETLAAVSNDTSPSKHSTLSDIDDITLPGRPSNNNRTGHTRTTPAEEANSPPRKILRL